MKYAVVKHGSKQYKVIEGETVLFDHLALVKPQDNYEFDSVLLVVEGENRHVGKPTITGAKVKGVVVEHKKGEKIRVAKFKAKVRYRRVRGFRPQYTAVKITSITVK